uniref:frizzled-5-like n=1 Tax=Myxine glutinosa TaxID=7769 RepID=UPI00358F160B
MQAPRMVVLAMLILTPAGWTSHGTSAQERRRCDEITVPMCRGVGYNFTVMPNAFKHRSQDEAGLEVHQFWPLVEIECSPDLRFFLCSLYTPICLHDYSKPLPPCRAVCQRAREGCAPLMSQYGFAWPERMRCERLPAHGEDDQLCMDHGSGQGLLTTRAPQAPRAVLPPQPERPAPRTPPDPPSWPDTLNEKLKRGVTVGCPCGPPLVSLNDDRRSLSDCAVPCHPPFVRPDKHTLLVTWIGLWAALCLATAMATVATFLIDTHRFGYPERPIIFLAVCYVFVSAGYLVRLVAGHELVACGGNSAHVPHAGSGPALCTAVFLLTYFFGMASATWWVVLSLAWFLAAAKKWSSESIAGFAPYFHVAAWLPPSLESIAVLALGAVDGEPVSGMCRVGHHPPAAQRAFVLAPLALCLALGTAFLLGGFAALLRVRRHVRRGGAKTVKLERLMARIGAFALLYAAPGAALLACLAYEHGQAERWLRSLACPCSEDTCSGPEPHFTVFMLKHLMALLPGIATGAWTWSGKTLGSWRRFYRRGRPREAKPVVSSPITLSARIDASRPSPRAPYPKALPFSQV